MKEQHNSQLATLVYILAMRKQIEEEIELLRSRIEPHDTGHLYTTIGTLEHRVEELTNN